ncbi:MAG: ABC transporter ATP-binding protein/permease [Oscillospiraceae bacterium]|nr:ABC transporter ATP-binding protein/permease [Oscillospiraceae bacterium]
MINYFKTILRPLRWVTFPKFIYFIGLIVGGMMFPLMQVFTSLMQKFLVNAVEYHDMSYMKYVYILAAGILFMVIILNPFGNYLAARAMQIFTKNLREFTIGKLLSYRYSFYETYQTGDLVVRLREDLDAISGIYGGSFSRLLLGVFYGGGSIAVMLTLNWQLSIYVMVLCVSEFLIMERLSRKITENNDILQKIKSVQNQTLFDIIKSISFIKMASISRLIRERYSKSNDEAANKNMEINKINVVLNAVGDIFEAFNILSVFGLGIIMYFNNMIDLGSVMAFLSLQDGVTYMIGNLQGFLTGTRAQIVNCNRVAELMNQEIEENNESNINQQNDDILVRDLSFQYQTAENNTLNMINLTIPKGKITVIYGASGGGKSTLIKMLLALYPVQTGNISIGETDYNQIGNINIRNFYAYVEQSTYLFHDTVEANIRCNNETATLEEVMEAAKLAKSHDFIMQKPDGYQTMVQEHGSNFSGGEKQRIAIARAILKNAHAVIFDEATNAVDMKNESYIYDYMREIAKQGKTVLIIAHRDNARLLADNEIHIEQGMIVNG